MRRRTSEKESGGIEGDAAEKLKALETDQSWIKVALQDLLSKNGCCSDSVLNVEALWHLTKVYLKHENVHVPDTEDEK